MTDRLRQDELEARAARAMLAALKDIALGRGPYKIDPMAHAESVIEAMKDVAKEAIAAAEAAGIKVYTVGQRVEGGDTVEDYDVGKIIALDGDEVTVAWSNGTRTTQPSSVLRPVGTSDLAKGDAP